MSRKEFSWTCYLGTISALVLIGLVAPSIVAWARDLWPASTIAAFQHDEYWSGWALNVDGTDCAAPVATQLNGGPIVGAVVCSDLDTSTIYFKMVLPKDWDTSVTTYVVGIHGVATGASPTGDLQGDVALQCRRNGDLHNNTWGTEVALDFPTWTTQWDEVQVESAAVTPNGTCAVNANLLGRWQVDAAGTTNAVAAIEGMWIRFNRHLID